MNLTQEQVTESFMFYIDMITLKQLKISKNHKWTAEVRVKNGDNIADMTLQEFINRIWLLPKNK